MKRFVFLVSASLVLGHGAVALAEPAKSGDPAAAQALFYEARDLMKANKFAVACPKLEESLRLDYGIGTEFNLADCNEKLGRLSTAWSGFLNVASAAKSQNQPQREKVARDRAKALEARLPKLVIEVSSPPTGLEVKRDGLAIGAASWGTPVPVDPGSHRISATAPGKQPWESSVTVSEGKTARISVPRELPAAAVAIAQPSMAPAVHPAPRSEPIPVQTTFPEPIVEQRGTTQRTLGYITAGLGIAGLGVGAGFGIDSLGKRDSAKEHCVGDRCDAEGVSLRDKAIQSGDVATIASIAGGAALLGGALLIFTAPRGAARKEASIESLRAVPHVAFNGAGLSLQGVLP